MEKLLIGYDTVCKGNDFVIRVADSKIGSQSVNGEMGYYLAMLSDNIDLNEDLDLSSFLHKLYVTSMHFLFFISENVFC